MVATAIQRWGNSQGIRLPKYLLDALKWSRDEKITIHAKDNRLIIEQAIPGRHPSIEELFEGFDGEYKPVEIGWGDPVGREAW